MFTASIIAEVCGGELFGFGDAVATKVTTDSRQVDKGDLFIAICGENFDGNNFAAMAFEKGAEICLLSKRAEVPDGRAAVLVEDTGKALMQLAAYHREKMGTKIIAITGSVGKTTTKEMCACAIGSKFVVHKTGGNFNNEIGMPLTLLKLKPEHEAAVIEMGMSNFGEIERLSKACRPDVALITNIGMSHIENLGSRENILKAKLEILSGLKSGGTLIINGDDHLLKTVNFENVITYGFSEGCDIKGEVLSDDTVMVEGEKITLSVSGEHNLLNACGAMAAAKAFGIDAATAAGGIENFVTDERRQRETKSDKGFYVISDYYNASPQSVEAALSGLSKKEGRKIAVLGDMLELGAYSEESHRKSATVAAEYGIDLLLLYGKESRYTFDEAKDKIKAFHFDDKDELSAYLLEYLKEGDYVLIKGSRGMKMETVFDKIMR